MILPLYRRKLPVQPNLAEIERTAGSAHPLLEGNRVAAFTLEKTCGSALVVVAEVSRRLHRIWELDLTGAENPLIAEIKEAIRKAIAERHGLTVKSIAIVPRHTVLCDPTGAIEHNACRQAFLENTFERLDQVFV